MQRNTRTHRRCGPHLAGSVSAALLVALATGGIGCGGAVADRPDEAGTHRAEARIDDADRRMNEVEVPARFEGVPAMALTHVARVERGISGIVRWQNRTILAAPRWVDTTGPALLELGEDGTTRPWPPAGDDLGLVSVNGLAVDALDRLWVLDNARVNLGPPARGEAALVVIDADGGLVRRIPFNDDLIGPSVFVNDLAVDLDAGAVYVTETGMGGPPALLVVDLLTGTTRRVLEGHAAVSADPGHTIRVNGEIVTRQVDGEAQPWRVGANPIALAPGGEALLVGAMSSDRLWFVPTDALRDPSMDPAALAEAPHPVAQRGSADGMAALPSGGFVITDIEASGVRFLNDAGETLAFARHPDCSFPVAVAVESVDEGLRIWVTSSELHRLPMLHGGEDRRTGAFDVWHVTIPRPDAASPADAP